MPPGWALDDTSGLGAKIRVVLYPKGQTWATALQEHEAILRALENRDVLAAQTALRMHLQASEQRWVENNRREWS